MSDHPYDEQAKHYEARECEYQERIDELEAEVERLRELTTNDGKEIGSYREGTGLRGENRRLEVENERLRAALLHIASNICAEPGEYYSEAKKIALAAIGGDDGK